MLNFLLSKRQDTRAEQSGKCYPQINNAVSLCVVNGLRFPSKEIKVEKEGGERENTTEQKKT